MSKHIVLAVVVAMAGCAGGSGDGVSGITAAVTSTGGVSGSFGSGDDQITFKSELVEAPDTYDVQLSIHGLLLSGLVNSTDNVSELDGFASSNGLDTQITTEDRAQIDKFVKALEKTKLVKLDAADRVKRLGNLWAENPDTVVLQRQVMGEKDHDWTSICWANNSYQYATHDGPWLVGCDYDDWDSQSTSIPYVGFRYTSTTYTWDGWWANRTPDHESNKYEYGDCYGSCGADCPGGNQTLTWDCLDHDQCVRNGHWIAALSCDDEFTSASDDYIFAPGCGGT